MLAVSEDPAIPDYTVRKAALRAQVARSDGEAVTLFAADKIARLRELRREAPLNPMRVEHFRQCVRLVERRLPASPLAAQLQTAWATMAPALVAPAA